MYRRGKVWWFAYSVNKKQKLVSLKTDLESLAAVKALELLRMSPLESCNSLEQEFKDYLAKAVSLKKLSIDTKRSRETVFNKFIKETNATKLTDLNQKNIEAWLQHLRTEELHPETIKSYLMRLRAFCRQMLKENKLQENPCAKIELAASPKAFKTNFIQPEMIRTLIADAPDNDLRFVLYCGFHVGMRYKEIAEARWNWVMHREGGRGHIVIAETPTFVPKNKKTRVVPLTKEFEAFLISIRPPGAQAEDFILRPEKAHMAHRWRVDLRKTFGTHMKNHAVKCSFHDMRRSFASNKMGASVSGYKGAVWTGDSFNVFQAHYGHLLADDADIELGI